MSVCMSTCAAAWHCRRASHRLRSASSFTNQLTPTQKKTAVTMKARLVWLLFPMVQCSFAVAPALANHRPSLAPAVSKASRCRCVAPALCWFNIDWNILNSSVSGSLVESSDPMQPCFGKGIASATCSDALSHVDDEFWIADQPSGYQHTGLYGTWNVSTQLSAYSVLAETESDVQATVAFAAQHNLRLVVKNTGHDWFGRSAAAGSLLLWMHKLKELTFHDSYQGNGIPAVTVGAGVQFSDLYPAANNRRYPLPPYQDRQSIVMGGTCDSVGVAGCWLGGCYGPFTKKFGNGAVNMLSARVVLANGSVVTASETSNADLFYTLRGGGGGNAGVVTSFTAKVHPAPRFVGTWSFAAVATSAHEFANLLKVVLTTLADVMDPQGGQSCASGGLGLGGGLKAKDGGAYTLNFTCNGYESNTTEQRAFFQGLLNYTASRSTDGVAGTSTHWTWTQAMYNPSQPSFPWMMKQDMEIGTEFVASLTKWFPRRGIRKEAGPNSLQTMVDGIVSMTDTIATMETPVTNYLMFAKQQTGMTVELEAVFNQTAQNRIVLDTIGLWAPYGNIPSLPQLPPSSQLLKALWPRLKTYAIQSSSDPLWAPCQAGAEGDEVQAKACFRGWDEDRVPALLAIVDALRDAAWQTFPNTGADGMPYSGSYWNEGDYWDRDFAVSHWGKDIYVTLLRLKDKYDPAGLFYGHHAVGSERWSADGNCLKPTHT